ncbi:hypothetical protein D172_008960 [Pseudoalteromonas sp. Bsw20308]|uniref:hypothetical protein n=1 Tax=Pseudoalteromonas sp. Bsw20308 TaxID=283699 RepID=UPI0006ACECAF|nr:hypothetical protein [Pseudoalteromonas sp. Bsw20308]ALQ08176.1 hypothetical protein D172_008960 [Pseudoalteromonas sp. Bsw20308]
MKKKLIASLIMISSSVMAGTGDVGKISELFVEDSGAMAIKLSNGFPKSIASSECPTNNGWAGVTIDSPELKSALLAAKATQSEVSVSIYGCTRSNAWFKVRSVYVK